MSPPRSAQQPPSIPDCVLVIAGAFGRGLPAESVAGAIARGLRAGGVCATEDPPVEDAAADASGFEARLRGTRAVVIAARRLQLRTRGASAAFEIATRARQGGVPAYAIVRENRIGAFDARMLDLQVVIEASTPRALAAAGRELARLI